MPPAIPPWELLRQNLFVRRVFARAKLRRRDSDIAGIVKQEPPRRLFAPDWRSLRVYWRQWATVLLWAVSQLITGVCAWRSFTPSANVPSRGPLYDVIHEAFPTPQWMLLRFQWVSFPDVMMFGTFAILAAHTALHHRASLRLIAEFCGLHAVLSVMRSVTMLVTAVPAFSVECRGAPLRPPTGSMPHACNDLMFSGHTCLYVIVPFIMSLSRLSWWCKAVTWAYFCCATWASILVDHYTMDVLVAIYIAVPLCLLRVHSIRAAYEVHYGVCKVVADRTCMAAASRGMDASSGQASDTVPLVSS